MKLSGARVHKERTGFDIGLTNHQQQQLQHNPSSVSRIQMTEKFSSNAYQWISSIG
jgi:hypothetical protein